MGLQYLLYDYQIYFSQRIKFIYRQLCLSYEFPEEAGAEFTMGLKGGMGYQIVVTVLRFRMAMTIEGIKIMHSPLSHLLKISLVFWLIFGLLVKCQRRAWVSVRKFILALNLYPAIK